MVSVDVKQHLKKETQAVCIQCKQTVCDAPRVSVSQYVNALNCWFPVSVSKHGDLNSWLPVFLSSNLFHKPQWGYMKHQ